MQLGLGLDIRRNKMLGSSDPLFLDTYTGAVGAFTLYNRKKGQGNVIKCRRDSDQNERSFTTAELFGSTFTTWLGVSNNAFVTRWYNLGSGADLVQTNTTVQPQIGVNGAFLGYVDFTGSKKMVPENVMVVFGGGGKMAFLDLYTMNYNGVSSWTSLHEWGHYIKTYHTNGSLYINDSGISFVDILDNQFMIQFYSTNHGGSADDGVQQYIQSRINGLNITPSVHVANRDHWSVSKDFTALGGIMNAAHELYRKEFFIYDDERTDYIAIETKLNETHNAW